MTDSDLLEAIARLPTVSQPTPSPSGDALAFIWDETGRNELYLRDLATDEVTQISDGELPRSAALPLLWSPDGERVYYHRDEGGDEQYDLCAADREGTHETLVTLDGQNRLLDTYGDDLLFTSTASGQMNLHWYRGETGETEQVTDRERPVFGASVSPDGDRLAAYQVSDESLDGYEAVVSARDGGDARQLDLGDVDSETMVEDWHPEGDRVLVEDDATGKSRVGVFALDDDSVRWLSAGDRPEHAVAFTPDGTRVVAIRKRDAAIVPVVYDLAEGESREFDLPLGVTRPGALMSLCDPFVDDDELVLTHQTAAARPEVVRYDLATDTAETVHPAAYGDLDPDTFVEATYHTYESEDGLEIGGLLYEPDRDGDEPAPAIVDVHGGPHWQSMRRFNVVVQFLATQGYTVFRPNYRGSTGRGREFKLAVRGDWGGMEQADIAAAGRWLAAREGVDADRIAVAGASYGGYSAYSQLVQYPDLWDTVVARVGITDLHALYEEDMPHFKTILQQQMGDPEENHDLWRDRSPVEHVEHAEAPLCIIHGVNDPRCPISQSRLFREALEDERGWTAGEEFEYNELDEEGHGSGDQEQKIRTFELLGAFLDERL
ncbi:S9 family peptidase [Haloarchaeobius amylolyticus]|uniref:S9 family peptidase n=1 Tax=Haloarchaeobius amylolyticus TaxID=1198296 RepID=UPI002270D241|nr:S9 family peptidase [Haloarchaeobius amylolyticus]